MASAVSPTTTGWRVIVQWSRANSSTPDCERFSLSGVPLPAQIHVVACDTAAEAYAAAVYSEIGSSLRNLGASGSAPCVGPAGLHCIAWQEPSCQHVLVLVIGSVSPAPKFEQMADDWQRRSLNRGVVITALVPPLVHSAVFGPAHPTLRKVTAAPWGGVASQLARSALVAALLDEKPGVFISYLRKEASAGSEEVHDALTREGYRVFLDRFNGTPGRIFPFELAEAMSSLGLVALFETSGLHSSFWTKWEIAFARRFRLGPVAINFAGAPTSRATSLRLSVSAHPASSLPSVTVDSIVEFIRNQSTAIAIARRAYFETLVRTAAQTGGGDVVDIGAGVLSVEKPAANSRGCVLPAAVPGRLRHISRLVRSRSTGPYLLAGEHQHLPPADRDDLMWLASQYGVSLTGSASVYRAVQLMA